MEAELTLSEKEEILKNNLEHTIFSWSKQSGLNPLNIERAKGVYIYDRNGKRYIDFSSQLMNVNIGHGHPKVAEAVMKQMNEVSYVHPGMITEARGKLGKKLAEITPGTLNRTFFTNGGTEATVSIIKTNAPLTTHIECNSTGVGVDENETADPVMIFPNPANEMVHIKWNDKSADAKITVTDMQGKTVFEQECPVTSDMQTDLKNLQQGIYFLRVTTAHRDYKSKFVVMGR